MLVARPEFVLISRFEIPAKAMLARAPEHEVENRLRADSVGGRAGFSGVNPLGSSDGHELDFLSESPRLLEEQIGAPYRERIVKSLVTDMAFRRMAAEEGCDAGFEAR